MLPVGFACQVILRVESPVLEADSQDAELEQVHVSGGTAITVTVLFPEDAEAVKDEGLTSTDLFSPACGAAPDSGLTETNGCA